MPRVKMTASHNADAKKKRPAKARQKAHDMLTTRVKRIIAKYYSSPLPAKFMGGFKNALPDLFAFVLYTRIPSTSNATERGLREIVVHRKIRGPPRADDGTNHGQHLHVLYDMKATRTESPGRDGKIYLNGTRSRE